MNVEDLDILVLVGSPHEQGRSTMLAGAVMGAFNARGIDPTYYHLAQFPVAACRNCGACRATGECAIASDGFHVLSRHMDSAHAAVVVAPVYFAGPAAHLKAALDRCQVYWARKHVLHAEMPARRPAFLLEVGDGGDPFGTQPLETICSSALNCANLYIEDRVHRFIGDDARFEQVPAIVDAIVEEALHGVL